MSDGYSRLTKKQEIFVQALVRGLSQRKALLKAYPNRKNWKENSLDSVASVMFKNPKIKQRYDELIEKVRERETKKTLWSREESIENLRYVVEMNRQDLERAYEAHEEELEILQDLMEKNPKDANKYLKKILKQKKQRMASDINNKGITGAVAELNKMQGYNEETLTLNTPVIFTGEDELED